jgi:phosphoglycolate phosphatase-like HAD superfamily hydrolase
VHRPYPGNGRCMTEPAPSVNAPAALVLDVDGTLLDTVYLHVIAWWESFRDGGYEVSAFDIHRAIGRGSGDLVQTLVGHPDASMVDAHAKKWAPLREKCLPFHDVPELIRTVAGRGVQVVYCTSGAPEDVEDFRAKIGCDAVVAASVDSGDVEQSKPAPDIVVAALEAVGVEPASAVMVGDTVYDVRAADAAGVPCIGLVCGGISEQELREAGAAAVYGNPSDLLRDLEGSPVGRLLR